jgi:Ca2+/H+ antiporter, TMEM165/GDT1 family
MSLAIAGTVFVVIFLSELPDKTALASLILGSRYRPAYVFAGLAAAFTVHVGLAIAAGSLLTLLPHRPLEITVAVLFALGAVLLLRGRHEGGNDEHTEVNGAGPGFWRVAWMSFGIILVAEFGDLPLPRPGVRRSRRGAGPVGRGRPGYRRRPRAAQGHPADRDHPRRRRHHAGAGRL